MIYDCRIVKIALKNQYKPIPEAEIATTTAKTIAIMFCVIRTRFNCCLFLAPTVVALRLRFLANSCGIFWDKICTGIIINKKKI